MKKTLLIGLLLVLSIALIATPAYAKSDNAKGAIKADMVIHTDSANYGDPGTVVGSVILNTTAENDLIVVVNMDAAPNIEDYDLRVWINGQAFTFENVLNTNAIGHGNAQVKFTLPESVWGDDSINVNVVLRPYYSPSLGTPCFVNGPAWKTNIVVPLK